MLKSFKEFEKLPAQLQPSSNLVVSDIARIGNSSMDAVHGDSNYEESQNCDNPSYFSDAEAADFPHNVAVRNKTKDSEELYVEILEHVDHPFKNQAAIFRKAQHEQLNPSAHHTIQKVSHQLSPDVITMNK